MKNKVSDNIVATFSYLCAVCHRCTMQQIIVYYSRFTLSGLSPFIAPSLFDIDIHHFLVESLPELDFS